MTPLKPVEIDPRVCCPIVAGDYMRATGFFFEADNTYLVTARHNVLPTSGSQLETGDFKMDFEMPTTHSKIDIYLKSDDTFDVETLHLSDSPYVAIDPHIDIIAIQLPFNPTNYGNIVFRPDDIDGTHPKSQTFDTIGFPGDSFPTANEYDTDTYAEQISRPYTLSTNGPISTEKLQIRSIENVAVTHVSGETSVDADYKGLSGSPVLGQGLAGIHTLNLPAKARDPETGEEIDSMLTSYWHANTLLHLLE
jgi:hypothetical protein